jgi:hypothetical protein
MAIYMGTQPFTVMGIEGRKNIGSAGALTEIGKINQSNSQGIVCLFDFKFYADSHYSVKYENWRLSLHKYSSWDGGHTTPVGQHIGTIASESTGHNNIANATMSVTDNGTTDWKINVGADMTGSGGYDVYCDWSLKMISSFAYPTWTTT